MCVYIYQIHIVLSTFSKLKVAAPSSSPSPADIAEAKADRGGLGFKLSGVYVCKQHG